MEKKLEEYISHLQISKKSTSSIKNYKADVKNFLLWRQENSPEKSLTNSFKSYKNYLLSIYSINSVIRKTSSIKSFIDFAFPYEASEVFKKKSSKRDIIFLSSITISLCLITTLSIVYAFKQKVETEKVLGIKDSIRVNGTQEFVSFGKQNGLAVVVAAPATNETEAQTSKSFSYNPEYTINSIESTGTGKISLGESQTVIYTPQATKDSFIYLTPHSANASLYVKELSSGYFVVASNQESEVTFKWMLKNTDNNISIF